jgi:hypothetical protein
MREITAASEEQSSGIEEVNRAIAQMDRMTQQNAALVEQAAAAAQSMQQQSAGLGQTVSVFRIEARPQTVSVRLAVAAPEGVAGGRTVSRLVPANKA